MRIYNRYTKDEYEVILQSCNKRITRNYISRSLKLHKYYVILRKSEDRTKLMIDIGKLVYSREYKFEFTKNELANYFVLGYKNCFNTSIISDTSNIKNEKQKDEYLLINVLINNFYSYDFHKIQTVKIIK